MLKETYGNEQLEASGGEGKIFNFFMKKGQSKLFLILQDQPLQIKYHSLYNFKQFKHLNTFNVVCLELTEDEKPCPFCEMNEYSSPVSIFAGLNFGEVSYTKKGVKLTLPTSKKGEIYQPENQLTWELKGKSYESFMNAIRSKFRKEIEDFKFVLVEVSRSSGKTSPSCGDSFNVQKKFKSMKEVFTFIKKNYEVEDLTIDPEDIETDLTFEYSDILPIFDYDVIMQGLNSSSSNSENLTEDEPF